MCLDFFPSLVESCDSLKSRGNVMANRSKTHEELGKKPKYTPGIPMELRRGIRQNRSVPNRYHPTWFVQKALWQPSRFLYRSQLFSSTNRKIPRTRPYIPISAPAVLRLIKIPNLRIFHFSYGVSQTLYMRLGHNKVFADTNIVIMCNWAWL